MVNYEARKDGEIVLEFQGLLLFLSEFKFHLSFIYTVIILGNLLSILSLYINIYLFRLIIPIGNHPNKEKSI